MFMEQTIKDKLKIGVYLFVGILFGLGGNEYIDEDIQKDVFVCTSNEGLYECTGNSDHNASLSSTAKSCYRVDADGNNKRNVCRNGVFMPIVDYAKSKGVSIEDLIKGTMNKEVKYSSGSGYSSGVKQYSCPPFGEPCYIKE